MPRSPEECIALITGDTFPSNQTKTYSSLFPLGKEGYRKLRLTFYHTVVIGTGATPIVLSEYNIIKSINFRTSRNEQTHMIPAQGLYYFNKIFNGVAPHHTPMAAADAVYKAVVDIPFCLPQMGRQEDTILDSGRYSSLELEINLGGIADLFGAPGTATVATTMDMTLFRTKATMFDAGKPLAMPYIKGLAPFDPTTRPYIDIESAKDFSILGLFAVCQSGGTVVAGVPYTGVNIDSLDQLTFRDNIIDFMRNVKVTSFQEDRIQLCEADVTGLYPYLFAREGTMAAAYWTGGKSEIKLEIGAVVGAPATPQVDVCIFGLRQMRD